MSLLKDKSQLDFYITALENWEELQDCGGYPASKRAAVIFTYAVKSYPALCKEMTDHFKKTLKDDEDGVKKIKEWLRKKFGLSKHADIVRVYNNFLNTTRSKGESLQDFITRFETAYNEVNNLGETLSPTTRAIFLLRQADLSDTANQIITVNIDLDPKAANAADHMDEVKAAMRKYQDNLAANKSIKPVNQPANTYLGEFMDSLESDDTVDEQTKANIQAYILAQRNAGQKGQGKGFNRGGGGAGRYPRAGRVWKCDFCLCTHKRYEACSCPCTTHTRDKCPNPDPVKVKEYERRMAERKKQEEGAAKAAQPEEKKRKGDHESERGFYGYMKKLDNVFDKEDPETVLVSKVVNVKDTGKPRPLNNLLKTLGVIKSAPVERPQYDEALPQVLLGSAGAQSQVRSVSSASVFTDVDYFHGTSDEYNADRGQERIFIGGGSQENTEQMTDGALDMLLDTGSPSTIAGVDKFKQIKEQYPPMIQATFRYEQSAKVYEFGGGETTHSMGRVRLPMYLVDTDGNVQVLMVLVEILQQRDVPFLFGGKSMRKAASVIDLSNLTITMTWMNTTMEFALRHHPSGLFLLKFFPLAAGDERVKVREYLEKEDWTDGLANTAINYLISKESEVAEIITNTKEQLERVLVSKHRKGDKKPLSQEEVNKLHHVFGHAHPDKLKKIIMQSGEYNEVIMEAIEKLRSCEVCQVENSRLPRPRIALPRSSAFNHVVAMDLKENRRFQWAEQYKVMTEARQAFAAAESDKVLRKGLEQRIYSDHTNINTGDWIYFKRNCDRFWQGPAKLVMKDGKRLHLVRHGQPICINADDVLMNKPTLEDSKGQDFVKLPAKHQPPVRPQSASTPDSSGSPSSPVGHSQYGEALPQTLHSPAGSNPQVGDLSADQNTYKPVSFHDDYTPATAPSQLQEENENEGQTPPSGQEATKPSLLDQPQQEQHVQDKDVSQDQELEHPANSTSSAKVHDLGLVVKHLETENCKETSSWSSLWTSLWSSWRQSPRSSQPSSSSLFNAEEQREKPQSRQLRPETSSINKIKNIEKFGKVKVKVNEEKNSVVQKQTTKKKENRKKKENLVKSLQILGPVKVKTPCPMNNISQDREADIARYSLGMRSQRGRPAMLPAVYTSCSASTWPSDVRSSYF